MAKFTITAQLNLQAGNVGQVVKQLQQQFQGANVNFNVKQIAAAQNQLNKTSVAAQGASKSVNGLAKNIADAAKRFSALAIATGTFVGLARSIKNAVGDAIAFEREMVKIAQATGQSVASLKSLEQEISKVSTTLGVSSKELIGAARTLTQAGFAANKVRDALNLLAKTELAATFDSIADTTEGVIAILNQFGQAAQKNGTEIAFLERSLSAINQVSKEFAVESSDLITAVRTTGSAFQSAGGSLDELLALFTSVRSTTRESAESIATGFRTIFTRTQRVDTINNLKKLGIELQDAEGKFVGPIEATRRLSAALSTIDPKDFRFNIIVEELGGFRQVSKVIPLIQQFSTTTKALAVAQKASGSLAEDAATAQQALAVQISKVREQFLAFIRDLTQSGPFQSTIKALLDISSAFIRVADTLKPILPMIAAFGAVKLGAAFLPALNSSFKRKNSGGIIGFASGGLVPGQGNGDTVPAMLTPGEFVIRKSSVKKLGTDNLARVNKYAGGGPISALPGTSIKAQINKKQKDGSSENVGITNDTFAMKSFDKRQIAIYDEVEQIKNNDISFFYARQKTKNGQGLTGSKVQLTESSAKKLFTNNKQSADEFEKIVAKVTGGKLQTTKKSDYPVDIIKENRLIDVKYTPPGSYNEPDGLSKALNYELSKSFGDYNYAGKNNITLDNPKFLNKILTPETDDFKSTKDFSFYFPSFDLSEKGVSRLKVKDIAKKQTEKNLKKIEDKLQNPQIKPASEEYFKSLKKANETANTSLPSGDFAIRGDKSQINALSPYSPFKLPKKKRANGGIIEYLALGGPAGKSGAARAITIPRLNSYTFDKPAGVDLDSVNSKKQQYKLNAEDRLDYDVNNVNVDVSKLKVSEGLLEQYNTADDQKRGYRFEDILKETGMAKSLSQVSNARLDGITAAGDPFEAKSRKSAIGISELEDKLYGAISDNISDPEKLARARFNLNNLTENEDHIKIGKVTVFEDVTKGLGAAVKSKARMGYEEEEAAKQAKEQNKMVSFKAQQTLQDLVKDNFGSGFIIKGKQYSPVTSSEKIHPDVPTTLNQLLGGSYKDKMGTEAGQGLILTKLKEFIVRKPVQNKANGGSIADLAWLASGGAASGTDTVPAMLTPGEYVINKKSAQAIGYTNLNRMNKVGKFANGGAVDPQRMFFGGLKNRGVPASQQATNLISNSQATVSAKGQAAIVKVFDEIALNGGNTSAALKLLNTALKQSSGSQLKATKDFKNQLREAGKEAPKQLSTSLLLLSSVAGSVATDFTGLGDASKTAITSLITTFGVYQAITQSAADGLKDFGGTTAKIGKGLEKAGIAVAGLQAVAQAYSAYQQAKAKESSDKISKELELAASGKGNLNTITQESKKLGAASSNVSAVKSVTSLEAQILGTVGGVIGSAFGPIGTAAGLAVGTAAGAGINRYLNPPIKDAGSLFAQVNTTLFESDRALFKFNQQAEKFGEMNFNQVVATASAAALQYVNIQKELTKVNADLKNDPTNENLKLVSGQLGERLKNAGVAIDKSVSELNNKARKQIQQSARSGEALDLDKLFTSILAPTKERLKPSLESKDKSIVATAEKELADTTLELQRSLNADIAQILRQEAALKREEEARKAIIGSLLDEKAIKDSSVKFQFAVENLSDSVDFASSIFEKGLDFKGAGFFQKIAKSFELNTPTKEFQQGLSLLGSALGDKGAALGGKLQDLQIVTANLDTAFTQLQGRGIGGGINTEKFLKDYFGSLGANANGAVVNQFIKTITSKVMGENKSSGTVPGVITPELRKEIEATFNDFSKIITEQAQAIAGAFATYEDQLSSQLAKYAKTVESFINYQADTSDGFKKFNDVLAQATGRRVTLGEKEGFRQQKAGILGISDPRTLGKQLAESQNKMMNLRSAREQTPLTNRKDIELYQRSLFDLKIKTDQTVKSLESLADQSEKTGDILSEIERIRGQREAVQGLTKRFTFGTDQERGDITKSIQALQQVFATGNIGSIPEELRGAVSGLLDEFKDVPLFNGMTGEDVSKKLQYNQLVQAGVNPQAAQSIFTASSPEKKLINQLQATFMQEQEARRILAEQQFNQQDLLINSIDTLNMNFDKFLTGIFSGGRMQQMQGGAAQNALNNQGVQPVMAANADITIQQANIFDAKAKMAERQQAAAQKRAKGGLIYRAGGGSIFQPQGTDTVPAMLTPGEYVIQKSAVDSVGVDTLDHINGYARGGLVSYLQLGGMASRRDQLRSMPNNMLAPMAGGEDSEANSEITYRNLMNTSNARTAAQMGMPGGVSDQRGNEVVANARYRNIMSGNASANQNLIPSRAGGDNGMAAANRYYSRIANIRGKSMQEAAQEYYQQQQGQMMSAPIYSDAEINMTNNSQMGGIAGFRQNQFQRQMAVRQNFMGNQFAQRSNFMGNQFMQRSSYMNMTRLSPKQKRLLREQQMGVGGGMANNSGSAPVDSYAQSVAQNANDGQGLMPGQRVVTTAAGGTRVVRDLRGQNRKQDRERRESQFAQYGTTRDADYLEKVDQAEAMRENERQSLRVAQDNARNANDAQFNINKVQARLKPTKPKQPIINNAGALQTAEENRNKRLGIGYTFSPLSGLANAAEYVLTGGSGGSLSSLYTQESDRKIIMGGYREGIKEGRESSIYKGASLAANATGFGAIATTGIDLASRYATDDLSTSDLGFAAIPYGASALRGARGLYRNKNAITGAGKVALSMGQRGASVARQAVSSSVGAAKSRGSKIIGGAKNLSQKGIPNPLRNISPNARFQNRLQAGKYRPKSAAVNQNFKFDPISYPTSVPKNTSNVSAGRKVGTANSYINQNLTEQGLSYRGGISPYSPQGTAMRQQSPLYRPFAPDNVNADILNTGRPKGRRAMRQAIYEQRNFASGGHVDSVPAMLTPGEYVMSSSSVQKHGTNFMNRLNRGGKVKGFATGGAVGAMAVGASNNNSNDMSGNISALSEAFQQGASIIATAFNFEALNNIAGVFASFTESMTKISESLNGMTMTHQVTVDGQLNIAGLNIATIADAVKQEVSNLVANEVSRITGNDAKKMNPNG